MLGVYVRLSHAGVHSRDESATGIHMSDLPRPPGASSYPVPDGELPAYDVSASDPSHRDIPSIASPRPHRALVGVGMALAVGLVSVAFALGRLSAPDVNLAVPVVTSLESDNVVTTTPSTTTAVTTDVIPSPRLAAEIPDGIEPVAAVARQVGPAVVQIETAGGVGSGVIYDTFGLILTAAHVVGDANTVTVRLSDGTSVQGTVVGTHDGTDVAVVSIPGRPDLPTAALAIGLDPMIGSLAVALGSPFGLDQTVTAGVVSAIRTIGGVGMIQTDAAINPGNSGGPLVDRLGRVIGINDQIFTQSGSNEGVGFAISIDIAALVADQLVAGEEVRLARLGVSSITVTNGTAGALVQEVVSGSAAERAGLQVGDLIVAIDGRSIHDSGDLRAEIISTLPGTAVDLSVVRNGASIIVTAILGSATF